MKALKIDSTNKTITFVEIGNSLQDIYNGIGNKCTCFTCPVSYPNNDALYTDDEGLFKPQKGGFMFRDWAYPIVGNALILGNTPMGESADVRSTPADFKDIIWLNESQVERYRSNFL